MLDIMVFFFFLRYILFAKLMTAGLNEAILVTGTSWQMDYEMPNKGVLLFSSFTLAFLTRRHTDH